MAWRNQEMAEYRGEVYFAGAEGDAHVWIRKVPGTTYANDEVFEKYRDRELKTVPVTSLDAWYREKMTAEWRGRQFTVVFVDNGKAEAGLAAGDSLWAARNGLDGDQYNGYSATLEADELENVRIERVDYLARWKEKNAG